MSGFLMAISAGLCAASAAVTAKFTFSSEEGERICYFFHYITFGFAASYDTQVSLVLRAVFFLLTLALNGLMWTTYVKAMQIIGTVKATLTNTSSNLLFTALFGWLLFNESHSARWFCGATLIVTGILLMQHGGMNQTEHVKDHDESQDGDKKDR